MNIVYAVFDVLFLIFIITLPYLSVKKCFWREDKSRVKLFFMTLLLGPLVLYSLTKLLTRIVLCLILQEPVSMNMLNYDTSFAVLEMSICTCLYLVMLFFSSEIIGKWLNAVNRRLVTFVLLMNSVILSLSIRRDVYDYGDDWFVGIILDHILGAIVFILGILMYRFVITTLATLTDRERSVNARLFVIPVVIFTLFYHVFSFVAPFYMDKEGTILVTVFSDIIMFLFIWAFYVIIMNINATNEAIEAKDMAAQMAAAEARIEADLSTAKSIQISALPYTFPPFPDRKEFELFASMNTAKEVGGDFYDFYMPGQDILDFLIADVSGKGIPAAMFMMRGKTIIKGLAENSQSPAEVFAIANEKLCEGNDAELFITAWIGFLDLKTGMVRVANAGHNPPVLIRGGKAEYVNIKPGLMLAGMDGTRYLEHTLQLQKDDILYLYTDGVTEAMDLDENLYGEDRLLELLSFGDNYPAPAGDNGIAGAVCELVAKDIEVFVQGAEQSDDITMLCIRYLGGTEEK